MRNAALVSLLLTLLAPLAGCSRPCVDSKPANADEPLRPRVKALGTLPPGALQCLDTHPSASYDGSFIVFPKLDPKAGDAEIDKFLGAQGWTPRAMPPSVQKRDFDSAVRGGSGGAGDERLFEKKGTKNILVVHSNHNSSWKNANITGAYPYDCATMAKGAIDYCDGI